MNTCPVSVIIPTYNRDLFLGRSIESVLKQTLSCEELIVVDDGSRDETAEVVDNFKRKARVRILYVVQENRGPAAARNTGIELAKNDYIAFLDSDDHWVKDKLATQYGQMVQTDEYLISHTKERWLRRGKHLNQKKKHIPRHGDIFDHCLELCGVGMSTVMARKVLFEKIGFFDESMRCCEDYDLWLRASSRYPFLLIDSVLTVKEGGREDQVSSQYRVGMDELRINSIKKLLDGGNSLGTEQVRLAYREFEKKINIFANGCIKHGREELGAKYLKMIEQYREKLILGTLLGD